MAAEQVVTQTVSERGQEIMKETARNEVIRTSTTTGTSAGGSLIGGAAFGALIEDAIRLYDIYGASKDLKAEKISAKECDDAIGKRIVGGVGSVAGSTAGVAIGQVLIPVPIVGGIVGGVVGGLIGRLSGNIFWDVFM